MANLKSSPSGVKQVQFSKKAFNCSPIFTILSETRAAQLKQSLQVFRFIEELSWQDRQSDHWAVKMQAPPTALIFSSATREKNLDMKISLTRVR